MNDCDYSCSNAMYVVTAECRHTSRTRNGLIATKITKMLESTCTPMARTIRYNLGKHERTTVAFSSPAANIVTFDVACHTTMHKLAKHHFHNIPNVTLYFSHDWSSGWRLSWVPVIFLIDFISNIVGYGLYCMNHVSPKWLTKCGRQL